MEIEKNIDIEFNFQGKVCKIKKLKRSNQQKILKGFH